MNVAYNNFVDTFCSLYDMCCPYMKVPVDTSNGRYKSWFTNGLRNVMGVISHGSQTGYAM